MKTLIIGGGASGLAYGILSAKNGIDTTICERNSRVGKKLAQTGNGRCNLGNENLFEGCYNESPIARAVLSAISVQKYREFLAEMGILTFADDKGRLYPLSESASNVVDCLRFCYEKNGGKTLCDAEVTSILPQNGGFEVKMGDETHHFDKVVVACGSASGCKSPNLANLVQKQWLTPLAPSLVPVKVADMDKSLTGLRAKAAVSLVDGKGVTHTERGEVQFRDFGLSGICVFNLSAVVAREVVKGVDCEYTFSVDVVPSLSLSELTAELQKRANFPSEKLFYGILHNKLAQYVVKRAASNQPDVLAATAKSLTFPLYKLADFSLSQCTSGGLSDKYVNVHNLTLPNGIVALGEALDVDGICGGYNLYFAIASAIYAFQNQ